MKALRCFVWVNQCTGCRLPVFWIPGQARNNNEIRFLAKNMRYVISIFSHTILFVCLFNVFPAQAGDFTIARLKYSGGGDWYGNPTSLPNLLKFVSLNTNIKTAESPAVVETGSKEIYNYPYLYMNGHGRVSFSEAEARNLREYLLAGGFLHADDNYGMDKFLRAELKKVFPEEELVELPFAHPIYHSHFNFPNGPPKIHEHDGKPAQGFGIFMEGRLLLYYTYQCDLGDGWEDPEVHNDPPDKRLTALRMGTNIIVYALTH